MNRSKGKFFGAGESENISGLPALEMSLILDLERNYIRAFECIGRWRHGVRGLLRQGGSSHRSRKWMEPENKGKPGVRNWPKERREGHLPSDPRGTFYGPGTGDKAKRSRDTGELQ